MAGVKPFFLTGANAKVRVNNRTLAFCTNLQYSVTVNHATPRVLGMYEPTSVEPISYLVTGTFSIVKYVADAKNNITGKSPNDTSETGNGVGSWGEGGLNNIVDLQGDDGRTHESMDPSKLHTATGFEIYVYQKIDGGQQSVARIRDARITKADFSMSKKNAATQTFQFTALYADEDTFVADFSGRGQQFQ